MTPGPNTAMLFGRSSNSKIWSFVISRSPSVFQIGGYDGVEPVAITIAFALRVVPLSIASVRSSTKVARPNTLSAAGISSTPRVTKPTKRSRSLCTRRITALPSISSGASTDMPNAPRRSRLCAASAGAINSLLGMQPTRAHVVP